jgi:hypothetical protein
VLPPPGSRYQWFRRKLAPVALVVALLVLAHETCNKKGAESETIELRFGDHVRELRSVHAEIFVDGQPAGHMDRDLSVDPNTPVTFPAVLDGERATIRIDVVTATGPRRFERTLTAGSRVIVDLGAELDAPR